MNKKLILILISGVIMAGLMSKVFAMSAGATAVSELKQREIVFSGSKLVFSIPENFSADFPAENLVDQLVLSDAAFTDKSNKALLLRRWWDFTESSFLSKKQMGTIMLAINVVKSNAEYKDSLGLIDDVHKDLIKLYKESNKTTQADFQIAYPETYESFTEKVFNGQRWLNYVVAPMNASEATVSFISPLTSQYYVELAFTLLPSSKIDTREFEDKFSREFLERIMDSVMLKYEDKGAQKSMGVDIDALGIDELVLKKAN